MAKAQRDLQREIRWRELVARHEASGLSVRAFCRQEQLNESSFYAWRRTLAERDCETSLADVANLAASTPDFVPAVVTSDAAAQQPTGDPSIAIELSGGCTLRLSGNTAASQLADLVIALQQRGG